MLITILFLDGDQKHLTVLNLFSPQGDTEYPPPPPSPSITNRARIKAVPKLNFRKTSFSASESEDETRKTYRIRNDSVCMIFIIILTNERINKICDMFSLYAHLKNCVIF